MFSVDCGALVIRTRMAAGEAAEAAALAAVEEATAEKRRSAGETAATGSAGTGPARVISHPNHGAQTLQLICACRGASMH